MISVCMAVYNGEKYIEEQIMSIISQLSSQDELIVSDDGSFDRTISIVTELQTCFPNIRVLDGPRQGVIKNFENAISQARGNIIFLADQDDIWMENKVAVVLPQFDDPHCFVVVHDAGVVDTQGNELESSFYLRRGSKAGLIKNIVKNSYIGCCMAFRSDMRPQILPFPKNIEMHDWWIGLVSEVGHHSVFIPDRLIKYRRHGGNVSSFQHYPVPKMIANRVSLVLHLLIRMRGNYAK